MCWSLCIFSTLPILSSPPSSSSSEVDHSPSIPFQNITYCYSSEECPLISCVVLWNNELGNIHMNMRWSLHFLNLTDTIIPTISITIQWGYGDPHIYFPNGGYTDFKGLNNTFFNILSDKNISVAAKTMYVSFLLPKP